MMANKSEIDVRAVTVESDKFESYDDTDPMPSCDQNVYSSNTCTKSIEETSHRLTRKTKYPLDGPFAWLVALQGFIGATITIVPVISYGIFLEYYIKELDINLVQSSLIGSICLFFFSLLSSPAGYINDTYGSRFTLLVGGIIATVGFYTASLSNALWVSLLTHGFLVGVGCSFAFCGSTAIVGQWFDKRLGLAMGIVGAGNGYGQFALVEVLSILLTSNGLKSTLQYMALIEIVGCLICVAICVPNNEMKRESESAILSSKNKAICSDNILENGDLTNKLNDTTAELSFENDSNPNEMKEFEDSYFKENTKVVELYSYSSQKESASAGFVPSEAVPSINISICENSTSVNNDAKSKLKESADDTNKNSFSVFLKNKHFLSMFIALFTFSFIDSFVPGYLPSYAIFQGFSISNANSLLSYIGLGSGTGHLVFGILSDNFDKFNLVRINLLVSGVLLLGWLGYETYGTLVFFALFYGFLNGGLFTLIPAISFELFGPKYLGTATGLLFSSFTVGSLVSFPFGGALIENSGYNAFIIVCGVFFFLTCICVDFAADAIYFVLSSSPFLISQRHNITKRVVEEQIRPSLRLRDDVSEESRSSGRGSILIAAANRASTTTRRSYILARESLSLDSLGNKDSTLPVSSRNI